jgi:hypothetical protein
MSIVRDVGDAPLVPSAEHAAPKPVGVVETDLFCAHCGYNLHTQPVWMDERLAIPVCRCPECGRHQPPGVATSAVTPWLKRLGTLVLFAWIVLLLGVLAGGLLTMGAVQVGVSETLVRTRYVDANGLVTDAFYTMTRNGEDIAVLRDGRQVPVAQLRRTSPLPTPAQFWALRDSGAMLAAFAAMQIPVVLGGVFWAAVLSHWRRRRLLWIAVTPLLVSAFLVAIVTFEDRRGAEWRFATSLVCSLVGAVQVVVLAASLWWGRPIARGVVRLLVPPRQLLAFLWHADGKTMPGSGR